MDIEQVARQGLLLLVQPATSRYDLLGDLLLPPRNSSSFNFHCLHGRLVLMRNFVLVERIMKTALPGNVQISKDAKELMNECVFEFISFVTSEGISDTCVASFESC